MSWNIPGWSLSAEAFFYLTFPLCGVALARLDRRWLRYAFGALFVLCLFIPLLHGAYQPSGQQWGFGDPWGRLISFNPLARWPEFLMGIILGRLFRPDSSDTTKGKPPIFMDLLLLGNASCILAILSIQARLPFLEVHNGLLVPFFGLIIVLLARQRGVLAAIAAHPFCVLLGEASYALYLLHLPLLDIIGGLWPSATGWGVTGLYLAVAIALSVLCFRFVEQPARRAIRRRW